MTLKEKLKELSFQMMLNETAKQNAENFRSMDLRTGKQLTPESNAKKYYQSLLLKDQKGYELSLAFNELLLQNGMIHNDFLEGPDAAYIAGENMLYKYGLKYPISWHNNYHDRDGNIHFSYDYSDVIEENHHKYLLAVGKLLKDNKIDEITYERLLLAGEYYKEHRKLLSKYNNDEKIKRSSFKH